MQRERFYQWLVTVRHHKRDTARTRCGNCATVETHYGSLDTLYSVDRLAALIEDLHYSTEDQRHSLPQRHRVPIDGDVRTGSATLKSAVRLYRDFRDSGGANLPSSGERQPPRQDRSAYGPVVGPPTPHPGPVPASTSEWPSWSKLSAEDCHELARRLTPYVRFLHPHIVKAVVENNAKQRDRWIRELGARGIDPGPYLWERSPCAFPGVRRYSGSAEIAEFRRHKDVDLEHPKDALVFDDNDYPKQVWSYVFLGKKFPKHGPVDYSLAHLAPHKLHDLHERTEFANGSAGDIAKPLLGLYTSAANAVYVPNALLRPTDFNAKLRALLIRRAIELYGSFCEVLPPWLALRDEADPSWQTDAFTWAETVGATTHLDAFLSFRTARIDELLRKHMKADACYDGAVRSSTKIQPVVAMQA